jgi:hypothetical protein
MKSVKAWEEESKEYSRMQDVREQPGQGVPGLEDSL